PAGGVRSKGAAGSFAATLRAGGAESALAIGHLHFSLAATRACLPVRLHGRPLALHRGLVMARHQKWGPILSSPLSSRARRSLPLRRWSTPSARRRSATWRRRRGSPCR